VHAAVTSTHTTMCHDLSSLSDKISIGMAVECGWLGGWKMCQELTLLITTAERPAKSSGDLITWNNCRASSSLPWAAITHYPLPITHYTVPTQPLYRLVRDYLASANRSQRFREPKC
jgi:hypothetical protein